MTNPVRVVRVDEMPPGSTRFVHARGHPLLLASVDGKFHAVDASCPHAGGALHQGSLEGHVVTCPLHGAQFDVRDGSVQRGPATVDLGCYETGIEDGWVTVAI